MTLFKDPEIIKKDIKEIYKFTELEEYKKLKNESDYKYHSTLSLIFPQFVKEHPFLFKKIIMGNDLTVFYRLLDNFQKINFNELNEADKQVNINLYNYAIK
jgi:hypothetical protein